jgi:hypothetical protein
LKVLFFPWRPSRLGRKTYFVLRIYLPPGGAKAPRKKRKKSFLLIKDNFVRMLPDKIRLSTQAKIKWNIV